MYYAKPVKYLVQSPTTQANGFSKLSLTLLSTIESTPARLYYLPQMDTRGTGRIETIQSPLQSHGVRTTRTMGDIPQVATCHVGQDELRRWISR